MERPVFGQPLSAATGPDTSAFWIRDTQMRHRKKGRTLGRSSSHRKAMLRNLASSLILTERDAENDDNAPLVKGRVITTLHKAKEVRPLVEKCVTIARRSLEATRAAEQFESNAQRGSERWRTWRNSPAWQQWVAAQAPVVAARRRALVLLGNKEAVSVLFSEIAPRMADRPGGYTRLVKLAAPRLGDGGARAILEFVGKHDRQKVKSQRPAFDDTALDEDMSPATAAEDQPATPTDSGATRQDKARDDGAGESGMNS